MATSTAIPNGEILESEAKSDDVKPTNAKGGAELPQSTEVDEGSRRTEEGEEGRLVEGVNVYSCRERELWAGT